ncbi:MAG: hypothetical protein E6Q92_12695, partial [Burkholderiaceae bacterium]
MDFQYQEKNSSRKLVGLGVVVGIHVLLFWALDSGLAHNIVKKVKEEIVASTIPEPPPPPPPPHPTTTPHPKTPRHNHHKKPQKA